MPFSKLEVSWHHMFKTCLNLAMCKGMEDTSPVNVPDRLSVLLAYQSSRAGCSQALLPLWIGRMLADSERLVVKNVVGAVSVQGRAGSAVCLEAHDVPILHVGSPRPARCSSCMHPRDVFIGYHPPGHE